MKTDRRQTKEDDEKLARLERDIAALRAELTSEDEQVGAQIRLLAEGKLVSLERRLQLLRKS